MYIKTYANNKIISYPCNPFTENINISFPSNWSGGKIGNVYYKTLTPVPQPTVNIGWQIEESTPIYDSNTDSFTQTWNTTLSSKEDLLNMVADQKYQYEVKGISVANVSYHTDRESQMKYTMIAVELSQLSNTDSWSINWKTANGDFVTLNANQMSEVISAVRTHVQSCYDVEYYYRNLINTSNTSVLQTTDFMSKWNEI